MSRDYWTNTVADAARWEADHHIDDVSIDYDPADDDLYRSDSRSDRD